MGRVVGVCVLALLGALFVNRGAVAGNITVYTDRSAFDTAMNVPLSVEDFTSGTHYPITTGILNSKTNFTPAYGTPIKPGDILPGVTYSTPIPPSPYNKDNFFNIDGGYYFQGGFLDSSIGGAPANDPTSRALTTTFDNPVAGFGFDTSPYMGTTLTISITFKSGPDYTNDTLTIGSGVTFFGFISSATDIVSATMYGNDSDHSFAIDNFTFPVSAASVPEPSSIVGASLAVLIGAAGTWRRRARRSRSR